MPRSLTVRTKRLALLLPLALACGAGPRDQRGSGGTGGSTAGTGGHTGDGGTAGSGTGGTSVAGTGGSGTGGAAGEGPPVGRDAGVDSRPQEPPDAAPPLDAPADGRSAEEA